MTVSVSDLCADVKGLLRDAYGSLWIAGEVQRLKPSRNGHLFFELVEKGRGDEIVAKLEAVIWRRDYEAVKRTLAAADQEIVEGGEIRCRAGLDLYAPFGRLQLAVREVDPLFSLGQLAARRQKTLAELKAAGLLELNGSLELSEHPLDLVLITSRESAAYHDFLATLQESGFGFRITLFDAAMQGRDAERAVSSALAAASELPVAAAVLIRGGGSRTDLAAFDSRRIAEAVARCRVPVVTGLGHQIDESIADLVAHTALKTPTKAAEFLAGRVDSSDRSQREMAARMIAGAERLIQGGLHRVARAETGFTSPRLRLAALGARLEEMAGSLARVGARGPIASERALARLSNGLARAAPRRLAGRSQRVGTLGERLVRGSQSRIKTLRATLAGWEGMTRELSPERVLSRGFSITRDPQGRVLRHGGQIGYGDVVTTQLADGTFRSRVEE